MLRFRLFSRATCGLQERLRGNVDSILLDYSTPEGRTLAQFLATYRQTSRFGHDQGNAGAAGAGGSNPRFVGPNALLANSRSTYCGFCRISKLHAFCKGMVKYIMDNRLEEIRRGNFGENEVEEDEDTPLPQELERMLSEHELGSTQDNRDPSIDYSDSSRASRASRASGDSSPTQGRSPGSRARRHFTTEPAIASVHQGDSNVSQWKIT